MFFWVMERKRTTMHTMEIQSNIAAGIHAPYRKLAEAPESATTESAIASSGCNPFFLFNIFRLLHLFLLVYDFTAAGQREGIHLTDRSLTPTVWLPQR